MAALTADVERYAQLPDRGYTWNFEGIVDTFFKGAFVTGDTNGLAKPAGGPTEPILGMYRHAKKEITSTSTGDDKQVSLIVGSIVQIKTTNALAVQANVGKSVMLSNDNDIALHSGANQKLGKIIRVDAENDVVTVDMGQGS